jgi:hypothetical protein
MASQAIGGAAASTELPSFRLREPIERDWSNERARFPLEPDVAAQLPRAAALVDNAGKEVPHEIVASDGNASVEPDAPTPSTGPRRTTSTLQPAMRSLPATACATAGQPPSVHELSAGLGTAAVQLYYRKGQGKDEGCVAISEVRDTDKAFESEPWVPVAAIGSSRSDSRRPARRASATAAADQAQPAAAPERPRLRPQGGELPNHRRLRSFIPRRPDVRAGGVRLLAPIGVGNNFMLEPIGQSGRWRSCSETRSGLLGPQQWMHQGVGKPHSSRRRWIFADDGTPKSRA